MSELSFVVFTNQIIEQHMSEVPSVPQYWHFSSTILRSTESADNVQHKLFRLLQKLKVDIEETSQWHYRLQTVRGDVYLDIDCYFFRQNGEIIIDINLLSGERFTWGRLKKNINAMFRDTDPCLHIPKTIGAEMSEQLLLRLNTDNKNEIRRALRKLSLTTSSFDMGPIKKWSIMSTDSFLDREIQYWTETILTRKSKL
jgi:hypothetical protein|tara:strand:- start:90 stop:686 length:597 start_codon:yes stop_codon:yes gene_type:complete